MANINIAPASIEIGETDAPNGHFWRMQFVDAETGDIANITFTDPAFFDFCAQIADVRRRLRS